MGWGRESCWLNVGDIRGHNYSLRDDAVAAQMVATISFFAGQGVDGGASLAGRGLCAGCYSAQWLSLGRMAAYDFDGAVFVDEYQRNLRLDRAVDLARMDVA